MAHEDEPNDEELEGYLETLAIHQEELGVNDGAAPKGFSPATPTTERHPRMAPPPTIADSGESEHKEPRFRREVRPIKKTRKSLAGVVALATTLLLLVGGTIAVSSRRISRTLPIPPDPEEAVEVAAEIQGESFFDFLEKEDRARREREEGRAPLYRLKAKAGAPSEDEGRPEAKEPTKLRGFLDQVFDAFGSLFT